VPTPLDPKDSFLLAKPRLWGIAYRMLGSIADAEDALQDTYVRWLEAEVSSIKNAEAWLMSVCTRRCIDMLKAAQRKRVNYIGTWLPEPVVEEDAYTSLNDVELAASLTTAFMLLLERLTPVERAVYLLHEVFDYSYADTAKVVKMTDIACRQVNSRLKKHLTVQNVRSQTSQRRSETLLKAFLHALNDNNPQALTDLLAEDVEFWSDGGGKVMAMKQIIRGRLNVVALLHNIWQNFWSNLKIKETIVNSQPGILLYENNKVVGTLCLKEDDAGNTAVIYVVRNPDKLSHIASTSPTPASR